MAYPQTRLTVSASTNFPVILVIDGRNYNLNNGRGQSDNEILINDLRAGYHSIQVIDQSRSNNRFGRRNNTKLLYQGNIYVKDQYHTDIVINRFGRAFIDEQLIQDDYNNNGYPGQSNNGNWNQVNGNYAQPMNDRSFQQFKAILAREQYEESRLSMAKQSMSSNAFSSVQVQELVRLFSFEQNRLDLAKYAYTYTVDKNNYYLVSDALQYSTSKAELARYLQQRR
jgi:hypothetical protein